MTSTIQWLMMVTSALALSACDDGGIMPGDDGGGGPGDDAGSVEVRRIAEFDGASFELPESLAYHDERAYLSFLNGAVVTVDADGEVAAFGGVTIDPPGSAYALGVTVDTDGMVYLAMAKASATSDFAAGVYRIAATGGEGEPFASHPELYLPNDVDIGDDGHLYITADGRLYRASTAAPAEAEVWIEDPSLASSDGATGPCGARTSPFPIGANGIEVEADRVVVGNTESGSLVAIPIRADGSAGIAGPLVVDPAALCGVDGLVGDADGSFLVTALGASLVRVASDGSATSVVHTGSPFRTPSGVDVGTFGGRHHALVANPDFEHAFGAGGPSTASPNLTAVPL